MRRRYRPLTGGAGRFRRRFRRRFRSRFRSRFRRRGRVFRRSRGRFPRARVIGQRF